MPVSVVCEAANAALRESLANSCGSSDKIGSNGNNSSESENLQQKLVASAKRVLLTKIEYEEVSNYGQTVLDTLKTKYIILKPNVNNGASSSSANAASISSSSSAIASSSTSSSNHTNTNKQASVNGNNHHNNDREGE